MSIVILGVVLLVVGVVVVLIYPGRPLHQDGGIGLAVLGAIVAAGGVMMKAPTAAVAGQFKCGSCGKTFSSDEALKAHSKDKHGM